jgi:hypothetical protein
MGYMEHQEIQIPLGRHSIHNKKPYSSFTFRSCDFYFSVYTQVGVSIMTPTLLRQFQNSIIISMLRPNQSLKLTEPAVDDFARAKQPVTVGLDIPRADWISLRRLFAAAA